MPSLFSITLQNRSQARVWRPTDVSIWGTVCVPRKQIIAFSRLSQLTRESKDNSHMCWNASCVVHLWSWKMKAHKFMRFDEPQWTTIRNSWLYSMEISVWGSFFLICGQLVDHAASEGQDRSWRVTRGLMHIDSQHKSFITIIAAFWNIPRISEALLFAIIRSNLAWRIAGAYCVLPLPLVQALWVERVVGWPQISRPRAGARTKLCFPLLLWYASIG